MQRRQMGKTKEDWPLMEDDLLHAAKRYATGDDTLDQNKREARRCLRKLLMYGSADAKWEAWKIIDSGVVGNCPFFLLFRFWEMAKMGRANSSSLFSYSFGSHLMESYAEILMKWRLVLYVGEVLAIVILLIQLIF